ncbi:MAG: PilZ domain-containing protein [Candidatus Omnitrophica bacterium]|nr:PilZ domain-containing protein [Candidatus Omnitrophota bacterium]MBU1869300.1 PilZ domain-containing protein [Candidatus Omnitrophota bacterium]
MRRSKKKEKREHPRINHTLPLKVAANGFDFITTTQNISCLGAYCHINKYIPPFTRVNLKLTLPISGARIKKEYDVNCKGVIVRTEDEGKGGFNIAIFFNDIKENQKKKISEYVNQFLPQESLKFCSS